MIFDHDNRRALVDGEIPLREPIVLEIEGIEESELPEQVLLMFRIEKPQCLHAELRFVRK